MDAKEWERCRERLNTINALLCGANKSIQTDVGFVAGVLSALGNRVFAQPRYVMGVDLAAKPTRRFEVGDEVITLCDGAVFGQDQFKKGSRGKLTGYSGDGFPLVIFDGDHRSCSWLCGADQLELAPKDLSAEALAKAEQKFWQYDCVECDDPELINLTQNEAYVVREIAWETDGRIWVRVKTDNGIIDGYRQACFTLVAPGPNHPKD